MDAFYARLSSIAKDRAPSFSGKRVFYQEGGDSNALYNGKAGRRMSFHDQEGMFL
jgi:hypothetical protein